MTIRTAEKTVTFDRPFALSGSDRTYPAGAYLVQTDEELIEELSFSAWRRVATMIHVRHDGTTQSLNVDPQELELLLLRDGSPVSVR